MARKKRRRPRTPTRPPVQPAATTPTDEVEATGSSGEAPVEARRSARADRSVPQRTRLGERMRAPSPFPPLTTTLGRSLLAVGSTVPTVLFPLVVVGAMWLGLVGAGMEVFPRTLVEALALPPISSFYSDVLIPAGIFGVTFPAALTTLVLTLVRALVWSLLVGMILESLEFGVVSAVGVLQGLRAFPAILIITSAGVLAVVGSNLILPAILGSLGLLVFTAVLAGGIYLFPMASAAAVRGPLPGREALRRSARAARLPGPRHLVIFIVYFFVVLLLVALVPGGSIVTANPPLAEWIWVLAGTVVQMVFVGAFCYRWMVVEDQVPASPPPTRRPRPRR